MAPLRALAPHLAAGWIRLVGLTSRLEWHGLEHVRPFLDAGTPVIFAFWHQRQVSFVWTHRGRDISVLVSRSRDGEVIARTMELMGIPAVRGSSSRGASESTRALLELLERGRCVGITPDGPKGPARKVKNGALYLAQRSGRPIIPITNASSRRREFARAWDRFQVPLPFSRMSVRHGPPVFVGPHDDLAVKAAELERALDEATRLADADVGGPR